jgi:hypothetical protein
LTTAVFITRPLIECLDTITGGIGRNEDDSGETAVNLDKLPNMYDDALTARNDATMTRNNCVNKFNERNYADAETITVADADAVASALGVK